MGKFSLYMLMGFCIALFSMAAYATAGEPGLEAGREIEEALLGLVSQERNDIERSIQRLGAAGSQGSLPALIALRDGRLRAEDKGRRVFILSDDETSAKDVITGVSLSAAGLELSTPVIDNAIRRAIQPVIAQLMLFSANTEERLAATADLMKNPREEFYDTIKIALEKETDTKVREALNIVLARIDIHSTVAERRLEAVSVIGNTGNIDFKSILQELLEKNENGGYAEPDAAVREAARTAISAIERKQALINQVGNLFYGLSLGSVLLLAALGLAITFGLMGVINMAHGEMLMIGAYATYVMQNIFHAYLPSAQNWYILAAIPAAFGVSGIMGIALERLVIRHLYGRPLETLLATWGISLILIQTVRLIFGAQNVEVANPAWLSGGVDLVQGVVLPYSRLAIIIFVIAVVSAVWVLFQHTRFGLYARAVIQNRPMASCMGIPASMMDMWTFGLGSGVAGLGGVALSQIGNVGPELGQAYIVDSFMVVVLGGVGKIAGTVVGSMGLGIVNKFLEPFSGAVLGKIFVLVFIVLFIQKRPQGIFALKGRVTEN